MRRIAAFKVTPNGHSWARQGLHSWQRSLGSVVSIKLSAGPKLSPRTQYMYYFLILNSGYALSLLLFVAPFSLLVAFFCPRVPEMHDEVRTEAARRNGAGSFQVALFCFTLRRYAHSAVTFTILRPSFRTLPSSRRRVGRLRHLSLSSSLENHLMLRRPCSGDH